MSTMTMMLTVMSTVQRMSQEGHMTDVNNYNDVNTDVNNVVNSDVSSATHVSGGSCE